MAEMSLQETLARRTAPGAEALCRVEPGGAVRCYACGHRCLIRDGRAGVCRVRFNRGGVLYVPHGYVGGVQCDPIEKKPFFHAYPGTDALSFGMLGCDYHCDYCQNWLTSQALRDPVAGVEPRDVRAAELTQAACSRGARVVASTYNEPLITSEWAVEVFREARAAGLDTAYISNGNGTPEALEFLRPWVSLYKVDLKGFNEANYRRLGGVLEHVLDTIRRLHDMGFWLEVVTLVVPGFNDSDDELRQLAGFLASVSPDIPWHVTAFHQDYRMQDATDTTADALIHAAELGEAEGLRYVYAGNLPGRVGRFEQTRCPACRAVLIDRYGFQVVSCRVTHGRCPDCGTAIPGVWG